MKCWIRSQNSIHFFFDVSQLHSLSLTTLVVRSQSVITPLSLCLLYTLKRIPSLCFVLFAAQTLYSISIIRISAKEILPPLLSASLVKARDFLRYHVPSEPIAHIHAPSSATKQEQKTAKRNKSHAEDEERKEREMREKMKEKER